MAPLTWREVSNPDFRGVADSLRMAGNAFDHGFGGLGDALRTARQTQINNRSAAAIPILSKVASEQGVNTALDQINSIIAPQDMSAGLQKAVLGLRDTAQGFDTTRLSNDVTRAGEARTQTDFSRRITRENQDAQLAGVLADQRAGLYDGQGGTALPDRELLARTLQAEAGGEGFQGMLAVGSTIANRAGSGKYGSGLKDVILAPGQFSAWNSATGYADGKGGLDMANMTPSEEAYKATDTILSGNYQDPTGGALNYYNPDSANPDWGASAGGNWTRIGNHVFGTAPGGGPRPSAQARIAALANQPGNMLSSSSVLAAMDGSYNKAREVTQNQREDQKYAEGLQAQSIVQDVISKATSPDEIPVLINQQKVPMRIKQAALGMLADNPAVGAAFAVPANTPSQLTSTETKMYGDAKVSGAEVLNDYQRQMASDQGVRILNNVEKTYTDTNPMAKLIERLNLGEDSKGAVARAMKQVQAQLGVSPAMAASILEETYTSGGLFPDAMIGGIIDGNFDNIHLDASQAKTINEQLATAASAREVMSQKVQGVQTTMASIDALAQQLNMLRYHGKPTKAIEARLAKKIDELNALSPRQARKVANELAQNGPASGRKPPAKASEAISKIADVKASGDAPAANPWDWQRGGTRAVDTAPSAGTMRIPNFNTPSRQTMEEARQLEDLRKRWLQTAPAAKPLTNY